MGVLQDQIKDVLGSDGAEHLVVALDEIVHVEPGDLKLDLLTGYGACSDLSRNEIVQGNLFEGLHSLLCLLHLHVGVVGILARER